mgnify:CR=1 FL=1
MITDRLIYFFEKANDKFISEDKELFELKVSERTLCGALMLHLHEILKETEFKKYHVDVEYNRNKGGKLKTIIKTIRAPEERIITINCDLIVHSRGNMVNLDNLIAVEMKKSNRPHKEKESDKERLICLTKDSYDDTWAFDGQTVPEHVCGYKLGIYYEINFKKKKIYIEYYKKGEIFSRYEIDENTLYKNYL